MMRTYHEQTSREEIAMSIKHEALEALKRTVERIGRDGARHGGKRERERVSVGIPEIDQTLGGGLERGSVHEVMAIRPQDWAASCGFALGLMGVLTGREMPWVWIRDDKAGRELGEPYGPGLASYGLNPATLLLITVPNAKEGLRVAEESLRCQPLRAVLLEPWGDPKVLDQTAKRRLALTAEESGVTLLILRSGGYSPLGSSRTRWEISALPSRSEEDFELGLPIFLGRLALNRQTGAGGPTGAWTMEWSHDKCLFRQANYGLGVSPSGNRSTAKKAESARERNLWPTPRPDRESQRRPPHCSP
jgi:protein ImuA